MSLGLDTAVNAFKSSLGISDGGPIMSGIKSVIDGLNARKASAKKERHEKDMINITGDEERKSALYASLLKDWEVRKNKFRQSQGLGNYRALAQQYTPTGESATKMRNFVSPNKVQDPGTAPTPQALYGRPGTKNGSTRNKGYYVDDNGQLQTGTKPPNALYPGG